MQRTTRSHHSPHFFAYFLFSFQTPRIVVIQLTELTNSIEVQLTSSSYRSKRLRATEQAPESDGPSAVELMEQVTGRSRWTAMEQVTGRSRWTAMEQVTETVKREIAKANARVQAVTWEGDMLSDMVRSFTVRKWRAGSYGGGV
ncbi:hypothetical protein Rs2_23837 [Raphanus sativus]|nr:hypothetical protein Rs2_44570 [Raphanus sativus]KAJ4897043.1 hypothetical protein Rs2_23837 [Raphanus sativus]